MAIDTSFEIKTVDASIVLAELLPDEENTPKVEKYFSDFFNGKTDFIAPPILKYEVANSFKSQFLRKRLTFEKAGALLRIFLSWPIVYKEVDFKDVFKLAVLENLSVYDASYLYLAKEYDCELITLDEKLVVK